MKDKNLIKSSADYSILKKKHVGTSEGVIYESDYMTISKFDELFSEQVPIFSDSNFKFSIRITPKEQRRHNRGGWLDIMDEPYAVDTTENNFKLNPNTKSLKSFAYYGGAIKLIESCVNDVLLNFPAELYFSSEKFRLNGRTFYIIPNDFGIDIDSEYVNEQSVYNTLRYFALRIEDYIFVNKDGTLQNICDKDHWHVEHYNKDCQSLISGAITAKVTLEDGDKEYVIYVYSKDDEKYLLFEDANLIGFKIRPKNELIDEFFNNIDIFEKTLLNRNTNPMYTAQFETPEVTDERVIYTIKNYTWPSTDNFNPIIDGILYERYINSLYSLAEYYDEYESDVLWRILTHESIKNFDWTFLRSNSDDVERIEDLNSKRIDAICHLYGRQYDDLKLYIDCIKDTTNISYSSDGCMPDYYLGDNVDVKGFDAVPLDLCNNKLLKTVSLYKGVINGYTSTNSNINFYKYLLLNARYINSIKGTRKGIDTILGLLGFEKDEYEINEYVVVASGTSGTTRWGGMLSGIPNEIGVSYPIVDGIIKINGNKDSYKKKTEPISELYGIPLNYITLTKEITGVSHTQSYAIPWFNNKSTYDGDLYFQEYGGWKKEDEIKINLSIAPNVTKIISSSDFQIYKQTKPVLNFAPTLKDLAYIPEANAYHMSVYYVMNINDLESAYTFNSGTTEKQELVLDSKASHYFILEDERYPEVIGYNYYTNTYGWRCVKEYEYNASSYLTVTTAGTAVLYCESIEDTSMGNNPHAGNGKYDSGQEYIDNMAQPFKWSVNNDNFSVYSDSEVAEIAKIKYDVAFQKDNRKCWYFSDTTVTSADTSLRQLDISGMPVPNGTVLVGSACTSNFRSDVYYSRSESKLTPFNPEDASAAFYDEAAANSIINVKNIEVILKCPVGIFMDEFKDYVEKKVMPYLTYMLPSTVIPKVEIVHGEKFTTTFRNIDSASTVLYTATTVYGDTPIYKGETPTYDDPNCTLTYTWNGKWTPELTEISGNTDFYASYNSGFTFTTCYDALEQREDEVVPNDDAYFGTAYCHGVEKEITYAGSDQGITCSWLMAFSNGLPTVISSTSETGAFEADDAIVSFTIPNGITEIGPNSFFDCYNLTGITIPTSVTKIDEHAFDGCDLSNVDITSVVTIGDYAFANNDDLLTLNIGEDASYIGNGAFSGCTGITSITVYSSACTLPNGGGGAFDGTTGPIYVPCDRFDWYKDEWSEYEERLQCKESDYYLIYYSNTMVTPTYSYFGEDVDVTGNKNISGNKWQLLFDSLPTQIGKNGTGILGAFSGQTGLIGIEIPDSITEIADYAFDGCSNLSSITFGSGLTAIDNYAFRNCDSLINVVLPDNVISAKTGSFYNCENLSSITIGSGCCYIGQDAFIGCDSLDGLSGMNILSCSVSLPSGGDNVFDTGATYHINVPCSCIGSYRTNTDWQIWKNRLYCDGEVWYIEYWTTDGNALNISLGSDLGNDVYLVGNTYGDSGLLSFNAEPTEITWDAFINKNTLLGIEIPDTVTTIGDNVFEYCTGLSSITIPDSVTSIGTGSCGLCTGLEIVNIGTGITAITNNLFVGCSSISSITIPSTITSIGDSSFQGCTDLVNITLPDSVTTIGQMAFYGDTSMSSVTIGTGCTYIDSEAFSGCTGLNIGSGITINASACTLPSGGGSVFNGTNDCRIIVPCDRFDWYVNTEATWDAYERRIWCENATYLYYSATTEITGLSGSQFYSDTENGTLDLIRTDELGTNSYGIVFNGMPNMIGVGTFKDNTDLLGIRLPESIINIKESAFTECYKLTAVTFDGLAIYNIKGYAFYNCSGLTDITIPCVYEDISDEGVFRGCTSLTSVTVQTAPASYYSSRGSNCIIHDKKDATYHITGGTLLYGFQTTTIPTSNLEEVYNYAFYGQTGLTSITIPSNVQAISGHAFEDCTALQTTTFQSTGSTGCTVIDNYAFEGCTGMTSLTLPSTLTTIGGHAFDGCSSLPGVTIPANVSLIKEYAFDNCSSFTYINCNPTSTTIDGGLEIEEGCFGKDSTVSKTGTTNYCPIYVQVDSSCGILQDYGYYFNHIQEFGADSYVNRLCTYANSMRYKTNLTGSIKTIEPNTGTMGYSQNWHIINNLCVMVFEGGCSIASISAGTFYNKTELTYVDLPNELTEISDELFYSCTNLTGITSKSFSDITTIGENSFRLSGLISIDMSSWSSLTTVKDAAFNLCNSLTTVKLPTNVGLELEIHAFSMCQSLNSLDLGYTKKIGSACFYNDTSLTSINLPDTLEEISDADTYALQGAFAYTYIVQLVIPSNLKKIGSYAFDNCTRLYHISHRNGVSSSILTTIGTYAFKNTATNSQILAIRRYNIELPSTISSVSPDWLKDSALLYSNNASYGRGNLLCYATNPPCWNFLVGAKQTEMADKKCCLYVPASSRPNYDNAWYSLTYVSYVL